MTARRIGERLVAEGKLSDRSVQRALGYQRLSGDRVRLGTILLAWKLLPEESLLETLSKTHRCEWVSWDTLAKAPAEAVRLLPADAAVRLGAFPYALERAAVRVAFHDPANLAAVDEAAALIGRRVIPTIASEIRLMQAHEKFYGRRLSREMRAAVQKLGRETSSGPRAAGRDFRANDLVTFERSGGARADPQTPDAKAATLDSVRLDRTSTEVPIVTGIARHELVTAEDGSLREPAAPTLPPPPDFYSPEPPSEDTAGEEPLPAPFDRIETSPAEAPAETARFLDGSLPSVFEESERSEGPPGLAEPLWEAPAPPSPHPQSLTAWIADAIGSLDGSYPPPEPAVSGPAGSTPAAPLPRDEPGADGMWQTSLLSEREDAIVAGMWTAPAAEAPSFPAWEPRTREEIAESLLGTHLPGLSRVVLLDCAKDAILGWQGRGDGVTPERVCAIQIHPRERSVFAHVERSGLPHFGTLDRELWPRAFADLLGPAPPECAVFPIRILEGIAAFLYADRGGEPMLYEDFAVIARAAAWTSSTLSDFFLRRHRATPVG